MKSERWAPLIQSCCWIFPLLTERLPDSMGIHVQRRTISRVKMDTFSNVRYRHSQIISSPRFTPYPRSCRSLQVPIRPVYWIASGGTPSTSATKAAYRSLAICSSSSAVLQRSTGQPQKPPRHASSTWESEGTAHDVAAFSNCFMAFLRRSYQLCFKYM